MIEELALENFRGFRSLELKGLKPVNLIVGPNNTGKTSLLEGILLACQAGRGGELPGLFRAIQGRDDGRFFPWLIRDGARNGTAALKCKDGAFENTLALTKSNHPPPAGCLGPSANLGPLFLWLGPKRKDALCRVVSVQYRDPQSLVSLIGQACRKGDGEETMQKFLAIIDPRIKKVRIDPGEGDGSQVVVGTGWSEWLPLAQVGQGAYRLATVLAELLGEKTAVLLIDGFERGLHYSILKQIWAGLAEVAKDLKVQIFATTRSGECLHAAHQAFLERQTYDLAVVQLFHPEEAVQEKGALPNQLGRVQLLRQKAAAQGRLLDKEHIEAAIKADLELR